MTHAPNFSDTVKLTRAEGLATVTLDRGDGRNPLSAEAMAALRDVARWLKTDIETHCVILQGARAFSVGADLKDKDSQPSQFFHGPRAICFAHWL